MYLTSPLISGTQNIFCANGAPYDGGAESQDDESLLDNPLLHSPQPPHRVLNQPLQQILQQPQDFQPFSANPYADYLPPPSNNPANSHQGSLPPGVPLVDGCKYRFFFLCRIPTSYPSFILLYALFFLGHYEVLSSSLLWHYAAFYCDTMQSTF